MAHSLEIDLSPFGSFFINTNTTLNSFGPGYTCCFIAVRGCRHVGPGIHKLTHLPLDKMAANWWLYIPLFHNRVTNHTKFLTSSLDEFKWQICRIWYKVYLHVILRMENIMTNTWQSGTVSHKQTETNTLITVPQLWICLSCTLNVCAR